MLTFVGLRLYDLTDTPLKGFACIRDAEYVFLEAYTSRLAGCSVAEMAEFYGHDIKVLSREAIEVNPEPLFVLAKDHRVGFLTGGDPMVSTTHIDLRMRAKKRGIETRIIHASSISTAVCGLTGLQNYRFYLRSRKQAAIQPSILLASSASNFGLCMYPRTTHTPTLGDLILLGSILKWQ